MKKYPLIIVITLISCLVQARLTQMWSYEDLNKSSDLVIICKFISSSDAHDGKTIPNIPTSWSVVSVTTILQVQTVLKGDLDLKKISFHHYRQKNPDEILDGGPNFVTFDDKRKNCFLLFLKKEPDGRYEPTSGQFDPALFSVIELRSMAK